MTAVPGAGLHTVTLICDECADSETTPDVTHDAELVWPAITARGWTGSPFATGRHRCPPCSARPLVVEPPVEPAPRDASYEVQLHRDVDAMVIAPLSDVDMQTADALQIALSYAARNHRHVVLDMRAAEVIDSAGLGMLVRAHQHAKDHGGGLVLAAPSRYVLTVLHTMRLAGVFAMADNCGAALDHLRHNRPAA